MKKIVAIVALLTAGTASASFHTIGTEIPCIGADGFGTGVAHDCIGLDSGDAFVPGATASELDSALNLFPGTIEFIETLDGFDDGDVTSGSAITAEVRFNVGDTIAFDWLWFTDEPIFSLTTDTAFWTLSNGIEVFGDVFADSFFNLSGDAGTVNLTNFGQAGGGLYTLGIGVLNVDIAGGRAASFLELQNFVGVPAPAPLLLLGAGLLGLGLARRR